MKIGDEGLREKELSYKRGQEWQEKEKEKEKKVI